MKVAIRICHWNDRAPDIIVARIAIELEKIFGYVPPYKVLSLGPSVSDWHIWVRLDVESTAFDIPKGKR